MQDQNPQFIIKWQSTITGYRGQSKKPMDKETALAWIVKANKQFPEIEHWAERIGSR